MTNGNVLGTDVSSSWQIAPFGSFVIGVRLCDPSAYRSSKCHCCAAWSTTDASPRCVAPQAANTSHTSQMRCRNHPKRAGCVPRCIFSLFKLVCLVSIACEMMMTHPAVTSHLSSYSCPTPFTVHQYLALGFYEEGLRVGCHRMGCPRPHTLRGPARTHPPSLGPFPKDPKSNP